MSKIETATDLKREYFEALAHRELIALRVPGYCAPAACEKLNEFVLQATAENYPHEIIRDGKVVEEDYRVRSIGKPFNRVVAAMGTNFYEYRLEEYFAAAAANRELFQKICAPDQTPFTTFLQDLTKIWPTGVSTAQWEGRKMANQIIRETLPYAKTLAKIKHVDFFPHVTFNRVAQLSGNGHTLTPGGDLILQQLPKNLSAHDIKRLEGDLESWLKMLECLEEYVVPVRQYDLIINRTDTVAHGVGEYEAEEGILRISNQGFLGIESADKPIANWV